MGGLLRYGVIISLVIVLTGGVLYLWQHGGATPRYRQFLGEPKRITEISRVWQTAFNIRGRSIIQLGLFVLILTPVARIIFSIFGYFIERDYLYIVITLVVLAIVVSGLF
jgi:uncharacterized membrane protein